MTTTQNLTPLVRELRRLPAVVAYQLKRRFGLVDRQIVRNYLSQRTIRKLHIGCGTNILDGWLNSDYYPHSATILHLDATKPFPLGNDEFDYVFSEHMIEHVSYRQGEMMLQECFRILRTNGKLRVSTPDLSFLINLYNEDKTSAQREYIKWATDKFIRDAPRYEDTFVINNFVRAWGHLFIYDEKTLRSSMAKAGFTHIVRCDLNQSDDHSLSQLENDTRLPKGFLKLETMTLEGRKSVTPE
jgi:predicted SAM-dependent methyltransferase